MVEDALGLLRRVEGDLAEAFRSNQRVMSLDDYFGAFYADPERFVRSSAQYVVDCIDHFGSETLDRPAGPTTRLKVFDAAFDQGRGRVVGQEQAHAHLYRILRNFVGERRVTRLILLHGPNGSAKSSFVGCLARSLEAYSQLDEGAVHTFNWVFPKASVAKRRLGFGHAVGASGPSQGALSSYAELDEEDVNAVLPSDLRDHPLLLLPREQRRKVIETLKESGALAAQFPVSEYLWEGDLSPRSRSIFDALLAAYGGDVQRVLQHVQVERFFYSQRYRHGLVTIEPQLHVDASIRQVTMDQGLQSLPPALRHLNLFQPQGDLVDGNRGIVEYNDLLKKPVDAFKYLLATCEKGTVTLPSATLHLDAVFLATSNDTHLSAFKQYADFPSFKGRIDLVKMPYLRDFRLEREIYDLALADHGRTEEADPHATYVLALWGVLTRLRRPRPDHYPQELRETIKRLSPLEKAELYAGSGPPKGLSGEDRKMLRAALPHMLAEGQQGDPYEGGLGASPRALKQVMLNALQSSEHPGLSVLAVVEELRALVSMKTVYDFLKLEPDGRYRDYESFIDQVFERYLDLLNADLQMAMGLVTEGQYVELFSRYILHVSYVLKGERLYNATTGNTEEPDRPLIERLEKTWAVDKPDVHRRELVSRVGAWRVEHPGAEMDYRALFPALFVQLEREYYKRHSSEVRSTSEHMLEVLAVEEDPETSTGRLSDDERDAALQAINRLVDDMGYPRRGLRGPIAALLKQRYP